MSGSHRHKDGTIGMVSDGDQHFLIDKDTRSIKSSEGYTKIALVQYDHNSERYTFDIPKEVEGHKLIECDRVHVHFINTSSGTRTKNVGLYEVDDLRISEEDPNMLTFSWLISSAATKYDGYLSFLISFECSEWIIDSEGNQVRGDKILYRWNTSINSSIIVLKGLNNGDIIVDEYVDKLFEMENRIKETFEEIKEEYSKVPDGIIYQAVMELYSEHVFATSEEVANAFGLSVEDVGKIDTYIESASDSDIDNIFNE